jgi:cytoskeletal protein CcmA (bactofilin family)
MTEPRLRRFRDRSAAAATLLSQGCQINGEITGAFDLHVSGEVSGDCSIDGTVTISENGYWQGTIQASNVIVAGHVEGDIIARTKVEITQSARIEGTVSGEAIAVAEGAVVEGVMKTTGQSEPLEFVEKRDS